MPKIVRPRLPNEQNQKRFWSKVDKTSDCWIWLGLKDKDGYGKWSQGRAHRVSYELAFGLISSDDHVCHECDNPSCVNPDHLWIGTNQDNTTDRNEKKRQARRHRIRPSISVESAIYAHRFLRAGARNDEIARVYGVSRAMASLLRNAKTWHFRVEP